MTKTNDVMNEAVRHPKHPFRQTVARPGKPKQHRYERRKIKEVLRIGAWSEEEAE